MSCHTFRSSPVRERSPQFVRINPEMHLHRECTIAAPPPLLKPPPICCIVVVVVQRPESGEPSLYVRTWNLPALVMYLMPLNGLYFSPYISNRFTFSPREEQGNEKGQKGVTLLFKMYFYRKSYKTLIWSLQGS